MRIARARTSGANLFVVLLIMAPSTQELEPPANVGRFTALGINAYDEFGIPASSNIGRFGYTGQMWLPEIGMWYFKQRVYSPTMGRFLQTDPIGYEDGINWYNYVGSDPINWIDPIGMSRCAVALMGNKEGHDEIVVCGNKSSGGNGSTVSLPAVVGSSGSSGSGSSSGRGGKQTPKPQKEKPNPCNSTLYRAGEAFKVGGKGVTYSGLAIAALGAPAGAIGSVPGIWIAEVGGASSALGQAFQDVVFDRPGPEIATRFAANLFGGKVFTAAVPASVRSKFKDALAETTGSELAGPFIPELDPARCPK